MSEQVIDAEVVEETPNVSQAVVHHHHDITPVDLFPGSTPAEVIQQATAVADALKPILASQGMTTRIGPKDHVQVEGWQTLGALLKVTPVCVSTRRIEPKVAFTVKGKKKKWGNVDGRRQIVEEFDYSYEVEGYSWEATVEARTLDGRTIGSADAMCSREEDKWKDDDDFALRSMAQCVPLRARILTRRGFVGHEDLTIGEEVLAYDKDADFCRWTPLLAVNRFGPEPVIRMSNRSFDFTCTPDHSWAVKGETGARSLAKAEALGARKIIRAAAAPSGNHPISPVDAEVLGWVITDGCIRYPSRGSVRVQIDQSKPEHIERLRELLGTNATETVSRDAGSHTFPSGRTYATQEAVRFSLTTGYARALLAIAAVRSKDEVVLAVTEFSSEARHAMLRGMLAADGQRKPSEGGFEGGRYRFSKQNEAVMETFRLLATLEGYALGNLGGFTNKSTGTWQPTQTLRANHLTTARSLKSEPLPPEPVWCPTTTYGTWVMSLDGNVSITGNTRASSKALASVLRFVVTLAGYSGTPAEEMPGQADDAGAPAARPAATGQTLDVLTKAVNFLLSEDKAVQLWDRIKEIGGGEISAEAALVAIAVIQAKRKAEGQESDQGATSSPATPTGETQDAAQSGSSRPDQAPAEGIESDTPADTEGL